MVCPSVIYVPLSFSGASYTNTVSATNNPDGVTQNVTVRSLVPSTASTPKQFIRLQVSH